MSGLSYQAAGVDIDKADALIADVKTAVERTFSPAVLSPLGGFSGLYSLKDIVSDYDDPVLVQSIDGVGTKSMVAGMMGDFSGIGQDLVSATVNDIIVGGAKPLTLLDYIAASRLDNAAISQIICSIASECQRHGISLVGGETAEMPDTYQAGEHDIVAVVTGVVDKKNIIDGTKVCRGDKIIGVQSSGLHTNGYSLARKVFFDHAGLDAKSYLDELQMPVGEALLTPHLNYYPLVSAAEAEGFAIHAMAHITGGGICGNLSRVLPYSVDAVIEKNQLPRLKIFDAIAKCGEIAEDEMFRAFNMGVGYCFVVPLNAAEEMVSFINNETTYSASVIGEVTEGQQKVTLV